MIVGISVFLLSSPVLFFTAFYYHLAELPGHWGRNGGLEHQSGAALALLLPLV